MKIVYQKTTLLEVCEVQLNRLYATEKENFERVILEDDERVMTPNGVYQKKDLKMKRKDSNNGSR
jgi:hypothetical protein